MSDEQSSAPVSPRSPVLPFVPLRREPGGARWRCGVRDGGMRVHVWTGDQPIGTRCVCGQQVWTVEDARD